MGLLDRALTIDNKYCSGEKTGNTRFSPDIKKMITLLETASTGLDFPSTLFSHIIDEFKIEKGALLLPDTDKRFAPWAVKGFDRTTSRRIRIPESIITSLRKNKRFSLITLENTEISPLKDFFSFREYSVIKSVLISPFFSEGELIAFLFICDGALTNQTEQENSKLFKRLSDLAGPLLFRKRDSILNKMEDISSNTENLNETVKRYIEDFRDSSFLILSVSVDDYIKSIENNDDIAVSFRIKQDILRLIKTLISNRGEVLNSAGDSFTVLLQECTVKEAELFVHQIGLSLSYFFKINDTTVKPHFRYKQYPADGSTSEKLIDSLN